MNHCNFLLFQSIKECTKNSPLCQRMFLIFLLGNCNKIILPPTTIYTYLCYSNHDFLNKGVMGQMLITGNFFSKTFVWSISEYIFISTRRGQGREVEVKIHLNILLHKIRKDRAQFSSLFFVPTIKIFGKFGEMKSL